MREVQGPLDASEIPECGCIDCGARIRTLEAEVERRDRRIADLTLALSEFRGEYHKEYCTHEGCRKARLVEAALRGEAEEGGRNA